jgi:hypothetical protein
MRDYLPLLPFVGPNKYEDIVDDIIKIGSVSINDISKYYDLSWQVRQLIESPKLTSSSMTKMLDNIEIFYTLKRDILSASDRFKVELYKSALNGNEHSQQVLTRVLNNKERYMTDYEKFTLWYEKEHNDDLSINLSELPPEMILSMLGWQS